MYAQAEITLLRNRKTKALARALDVDRPTAVGLVVSVWLWALEQEPDGILDDIEWEDLAEDIGWRGDGGPAPGVDLRRALVHAGLLDEDPDRLHDWEEHTGAGVRRRAADAKRKREKRTTASNGRPPDVRGRGSGRSDHEGEGEREEERERDGEGDKIPLTREGVLLGLLDGRSRKANAADRELHRLILECWAVAVGKGVGRVKMTDDRRKALERIFDPPSKKADGMDPSTVLKAAEGLALSDFHMGRERGSSKRYDDLTYALKRVELHATAWERRHQKARATAIPAWAMDDGGDGE